MILLFGSTGMLGQSMSAQLVSQKIGHCCPSSQDLNITDELGVMRIISSLRPEYVVNSAAMTAVDSCDAAPDAAMMINGIAVTNIARACNKIGAKFIHISTDYVFDGQKGAPYTEIDRTNPIQIYGHSKLDGENRALDVGAMIFRVQWLYGESRPNFVDWVTSSLLEKREVRVSSDQIGSPCSTPFLSSNIMDIIGSKKFAPGIFHLTHDDYCSRSDVALHVADKLKAKKSLIQQVDGVNFGKARRPVNTSMDNSKLKNHIGRDLGSWEADIDMYLHYRYGLELS